MGIPSIQFIPEFAPEPEALFNALRDTTTWDERMRARRTATFGVPYNYSGMVYPESPMPPALRQICDALEHRVGFRPNNCLANYYFNGRSTMDFHSDSIKELVLGTGVAIVSLGAARSLVFRRIEEWDTVHDYRLTSGSLLYMPPEIQLEWKHGVPEEKGAEARISLTFRCLSPSSSVHQKEAAMVGLEELLCDCAVIRTTFETMAVFPDDPDLRREMDRIIADARSNLFRRLCTFQAEQDHRLGPFISQHGTAFRRLFRTAVTSGLPRRELDHMMKDDVFETVAANDSLGDEDGVSRSRFYYRLHSELPGEQIAELAPEQLIHFLLADLAEAVQDDSAYRDKAAFDRMLYQKYAALLYLFWAAEDPMFRGSAGE